MQIHKRRNMHVGRENHTSAVRVVLRMWPICSLGLILHHLVGLTSYMFRLRGVARAIDIVASVGSRLLADP
jgi:hypothetical protein